MSASEVRVRFAPSPTGFLHIGGARTALFNWLYAKANNGKFLLRIEDTDRERSEAKFTEDILASLKWLGFEPDEEPVFQSQRFDRYHAIAEDLIKKGLAYRCECSSATLDAIRTQCQKDKVPFRYPGTCKGKNITATHTVIRAAVPKEGATKFTDLIREEISFENKDIDDWVIQRADGSPTYNFCVVVDDHDQRVSHVLRGDDHINNTPKQILMYQALGYEVPKFAHLPMILGTDRTKLSKRHGAASTLEYRAMGYLPEAMINFLVRLGWSHGDQEYFTIPELQKFFNVEHIGKSHAIWNPEKLQWTSGLVMRDAASSHLREYVELYFGPQITFLEGISSEKREAAIEIIKAKVKNVLELIEQLHVVLGPDPVYDLTKVDAAEREQMKKILTRIQTVFAPSNFDRKDLDEKVRAEATAMGEKLTPLAKAIRYAMTGGKISPGLFEMLEIQGKETVQRRIGALLSLL